MMVFWIVVAMFLLGALLMLLPPLLKPRAHGLMASADALNLSLYREQLHDAEHDLRDDLIAPQQLAEVRAEIGHRVLEEVDPQRTAADAPRASRHMAYALALLIPLGSVAGYWMLGDPAALMASVGATPPAAADARHGVTPEQIQQMASSLAERLKAEPGNAEGWMMLGRSYIQLGRHRDAVTALQRANELAPGNPGLLADLADVLAMVQGKRLAGEPARLVQQALDADPRHVKALALAGSVAFEGRDYAAARGYWERLIAVVPVDSGVARSVQGSIAQARKLEAGSTTPATAPAPAAPGARSVAGQVLVSPALAARIAPGDTLFVFARAAQGPRMPLAILRRPVAAWPAPFVLDDSMAMAADLKLSGFDSVVVSARISHSGNATPQPGDLIGQSAPVAPGTQALRITIEQVQ